MKKIGTLAIILFVTLAATLAFAAPPLKDPALEEKAKKLEAQLIAPCCWVEPVATHISPAAEKIKKQIRVMLEQGMPEEEIMDAFVKEYGVQILANPPAKGFFLNLYVIPPLVIIVFAIFVILVIRKWVKAGRQKEKTGGPEKIEVSSSEEKLLEEEMKKEGY
jgi:cytochrome c-type biogenesis protein CcmH